MTTRPQLAPLNILFATPECAPWVKTGGLGDVCGALPQALTALGHEVRVLMPAIQALGPLLARAERVCELPANGPWPAGRLVLVREGGMTLWLLDSPGLYDRPCGPYVDCDGKDFADNAQRFGYLSHVAALLSGGGTPCPEWPVDLLHCHDWTTGLAPAYLKLQPGRRAASVMTIHNLLFQGNFPSHLAPQLAIPPEWLNIERGVLHWGQLCFLKAGLLQADMITSVSPTYAREIQRDPEGCGLDGVLRLRSADLVGILNGIDTQIWCPAKDTLIPATYDASSLQVKAHNKVALQKRMGLDADRKALLLGLVSRLTSQKGIDLVLQSLPAMVEMGCQVCVLGTGDKALEAELETAAQAYPGKVAVRIGFDEALAHLVEAGADAFLMPSMFEPCGLNQLYSQAYGTPPIVQAVGGLADSVDDDVDGRGNGFSFVGGRALDLCDAVQRARKAYDDPTRWQRIQVNAMGLDRAWTASAQRYVDVYGKAMTKAAFRP